MSVVGMLRSRRYFIGEHAFRRCRRPRPEHRAAGAASRCRASRAGDRGRRRARCRIITRRISRAGARTSGARQPRRRFEGDHGVTQQRRAPHALEKRLAELHLRPGRAARRALQGPHGRLRRVKERKRPADLHRWRPAPRGGRPRESREHRERHDDVRDSSSGDAAWSDSTAPCAAGGPSTQRVKAASWCLFTSCDRHVNTKSPRPGK